MRGVSGGRGSTGGAETAPAPSSGRSCQLPPAAACGPVTGSERLGFYNFCCGAASHLVGRLMIGIRSNSGMHGELYKIESTGRVIAGMGSE